METQTVKLMDSGLPTEKQMDWPKVKPRAMQKVMHLEMDWPKVMPKVMPMGRLKDSDWPKEMHFLKHLEMH